MVSKKHNPPPPKPEEESSEEEVEEEEEEEEEEEAHQEKPQVSSSSGEEDDEEEETDSNEEEEDQSISKRIQPSSQQVQKSSIQKRQATPSPAAVQNSVSEEEETGSEEEEEDEEELTNTESESLRSPTASDFTVKPITVPANTKVPKLTSKRPFEASIDDGKGSGNGKKAKTGGKKGKGASSAGRIWNEDSEIVVLQGMIDYQKRHGISRTPDIGIFYEFIKGKLWDGVTKTQIADKLKRVKGKYLLNIKKCKNGQDPVFSKPHEKKTFELSKLIWGGRSESNGIEDKAKIKGDDGKGKKSGNSGSEDKKIEDNAKVKSDNPKGKKSDNAGTALIPSMDVDKGEKQDSKMDDLKDDEEEDFLSKFPTLSKSFDAEMGFLKEKLHLIGNEKARDLEEKWNQLQLEEMDVLAKRFNIMSEQIKLVLDAMQKP